jgi:hypothetical protein
MADFEWIASGAASQDSSEPSVCIYKTLRVGMISYHPTAKEYAGNIFTVDSKFVGLSPTADAARQAVETAVLACLKAA